MEVNNIAENRGNVGCFYCQPPPPTFIYFYFIYIIFAVRSVVASFNQWVNVLDGLFALAGHVFVCLPAKISLTAQLDHSSLEREESFFFFLSLLPFLILSISPPSFPPLLTHSLRIYRCIEVSPPQYPDWKEKMDAC